MEHPEQNPWTHVEQLERERRTMGGQGNRASPSQSGPPPRKMNVLENSFFFSPPQPMFVKLDCYTSRLNWNN